MKIQNEKLASRALIAYLKSVKNLIYEGRKSLVNENTPEDQIIVIKPLINLFGEEYKIIKSDELYHAENMIETLIQELSDGLNEMNK